MIGLAFVAAAALVAAFVLTINTSDGTIVIESSHPDVEVFVDDHQVVSIVDPQDKSKIRIEVEPGEHMLKVTKAGFEARVTRFSLKGLDGKPIKVSLLRNNAMPTPTDEASGADLNNDREVADGKVGEFEHDRQVARWVLAAGGGSVTVVINGVQTGIKSLDDLPEKPFQIFQINAPVMEESDFARFSGLRSLRVLGMYGVKSVSDNAIGLMSDLPKLYHLDIIGGRGMSDRSVLHLTQVAPRLDNVTLYDTGLTDDGMRHLAALPGLRRLAVTSIHHGDELTDEGLATLLATNINDLSIYCTGVTGEGLRVLRPGQRTGTSKLIRLALEHTPLDDETLQYLKWTRLKSLGLKDTGVSDRGIEYLKKVITLETLNLTDTLVTAGGIAELQHALPNCKISWNGNSEEALARNRRAAEWVLGVGGTVVVFVDGEEKEVQASDELPERPLAVLGISLRSNKAVDDRDLSQLSGLQSLGSLDLWDNAISDDGIALLESLPALNSCDLSLTQITDDSLHHLGQIAPRVGSFRFYGTQVTDDGLRVLARLPNLRFLMVHNNDRLTDEGLEVLLKTSLSDLTISSTLITGEGFKGITSDTQMTRLDLAGTAVVDESLRYLKPCSLTHLNLLDTDIGDEAVEHLKGMKTLSILSFENTNVSDRSVELLKEMKTLTELNLKGTSVTAAGIVTLRQSLPECTIHWDGD